ncbi:unnamed protein product, partial [Heterotrigona itama]
TRKRREFSVSENRVERERRHPGLFLPVREEITHISGAKDRQGQADRTTLLATSN